MAHTTEKKEISFTLDGVELIKKGFEIPEKFTVKELKFLFEVGLEIQFNEQEKKSMHLIHATVKLEETSARVGYISAACFFNILNFDEIKDENKRIPRDHVDILNSIAIGTLRGIMFSEFRGTILNNAILPIIDIKAFTVEGL